MLLLVTTSKNVTSKTRNECKKIIETRSIYIWSLFTEHRLTIRLRLLISLGSMYGPLCMYVCMYEGVTRKRDEEEKRFKIL